MVKGTRRIRACPKTPDRLHELIRQQRRACNLAVAGFREADEGRVDPKGPELKPTALRATIHDFVRSEVHERGGPFRSADCDEAVNAAFRTRDAVCNPATEGRRTLRLLVPQHQGQTAAHCRPEAVRRVCCPELRPGGTHT